MILELLVSLIFGLAALLINLIPDLDFGGNFIQAISSIGNVMEGASYLLPMNTFLVCISVFFILHNITFIMMLLNWIVRKIPGVN